MRQRYVAEIFELIVKRQVTVLTAKCRNGYVRYGRRLLEADQTVSESQQLEHIAQAVEIRKRELQFAQVDVLEHHLAMPGADISKVDGDWVTGGGLVFQH
jgi:hypothetical protein